MTSYTHTRDEFQSILRNFTPEPNRQAGISPPPLPGMEGALRWPPVPDRPPVPPLMPIYPDMGVYPPNMGASPQLSPPRYNFPPVDYNRLLAYQVGPWHGQPQVIPGSHDDWIRSRTPAPRPEMAMAMGFNPQWLTKALPQIKIEVFNDDPKEWPTFISSFRDMIHNVVPTDAQRHAFLSSFCHQK